MSKIQHIRIQNFKSVAEFEADFRGCTAIVTGKNNSGKSSFLRGIPDRIRFLRPEVPVKKGETEGQGEMTLTTGEKFIWSFNDSGRDKLTYITKEGLKHNVTVELGRQFFPQAFDIDKFLQSPPREQSRQLQAIVGLDFTAIDSRYKAAYDARTERNREAELYHAKLEKMLKVDRVEAVDLTQLQEKKEKERRRLNDLYAENKRQNYKTRVIWEAEKAGINSACQEFNNEQQQRKEAHSACLDALVILHSHGYKNEGDANTFVLSLAEAIQPLKDPAALYPPEPTYIEEMPDSKDLDKIDAEILAASQTNAEAQKYRDYIDHKKATAAAKTEADKANAAVVAIEEERQRMIESANMPKGIAITAAGITVDGLPLDRNQISTSKLYTSALRIAALGLGEVKTLYFDCSACDRQTLAEINDWAQAQGYQLLLERPDFEAGDMRYEIVELSTPE